MNKVFLGIGTNLGDREKNLAEAMELIGERIFIPSVCSSVYETEPWGFESESKFLNLVIVIETELSPVILLEKIHEIELTMGRVRDKNQYESRVIDIDILFYNDLVLDTGSLKIPHPHLHNRRFVLVPLSEIAFDFVHPVLDKTISSLLDICPDKGIVRTYISPLSAKL
jgi:2-amino-4-hydroxy-6-hydroxymethyldihydropteridine diphosphokinase